MKNFISTYSPLISAQTTSLCSISPAILVHPVHCPSGHMTYVNPWRWTCNWLRRADKSARIEKTFRLQFTLSETEGSFGDRSRLKAEKPLQLEPRETFLLQHLHLTNDPLKGVDRADVIYAGTSRETRLQDISITLSPNRNWCFRQCQSTDDRNSCPSNSFLNFCHGIGLLVKDHLQRIER